MDGYDVLQNLETSTDLPILISKEELIVHLIVYTAESALQLWRVRIHSTSSIKLQKRSRRLDYTHNKLNTIETRGQLSHFIIITRGHQMSKVPVRSKSCKLDKTSKN